MVCHLFLQSETCRICMQSDFIYKFKSTMGNPTSHDEFKKISKCYKRVGNTTVCMTGYTSNQAFVAKGFLTIFHHAYRWIRPQTNGDHDLRLTLVSDMCLWLHPPCFSAEPFSLFHHSYFVWSGPEVIKHFSCSTQMSIKFQLFIKI